MSRVVTAVAFALLFAAVAVPMAASRTDAGPPSLGHVTLKLPAKGHGHFYKVTVTAKLKGHFTKATFVPQLALPVPDTVRAAAHGTTLKVAGRTETQTFIVAVNNLAAPKSMASASEQDTIELIFIGAAAFSEFGAKEVPIPCTSFKGLNALAIYDLWFTLGGWASSPEEIFGHTLDDCD
jgi:hypothetical protein